MSRNLCKLRPKWRNAKNGVAITFAWQNEPLYSKYADELTVTDFSDAKKKDSKPHFD